MTDHAPVLFGNEGREQHTLCSQPIDKIRFIRTSEGGFTDGPDDILLVRMLPADGDPIRDAHRCIVLPVRHSSWISKPVPLPWRRPVSVTVAAAAAQANLAVILGTERVVDSALLISTLIVNRDGTVAGFQDKVQLDPSEESTYSPGSGRRVFQAGPVIFGVAICHEGFRYPETVRWAARRGAHIVFHPHFDEAEPGGYQPSSFADPANSFHEKAALCRAAENTCFFATVNCASDGSPTTSAVVRPDGTLLRYQPYGKRGLLVVDIDIREATGLLAARCKSY